MVSSIQSMLISPTKSVVVFFSRDPRKVNGKVVPKIFFGTSQVPFEPTPRLLGITLDCQLSFGPHTLEIKKKMPSRLSVLHCTAGRWWGQHPASLRALYRTYPQSTALYCASSSMSALSDNNLMNRLAVDMKFAIDIHIHRFSVDILGYIHIHRRLSCVHIATKFSRNTAVPERPSPSRHFFCETVKNKYK